MGMLTGKEIDRQIRIGNIEIDPYSESQLNPNSYNLRLDKHLKRYNPGKTAMFKDIDAVWFNTENWIFHSNKSRGHIYLDLHEKDETDDIFIDEDNGIILYPGILYLGSTIERTFTDKYVPMLNGRSSVGRKGLTIHVTAGFGDIGFNGKWTLEMTVVHPLKVYYKDEICQISFFDTIGDTSYLYNGRYQNQEDVIESRFDQKKKGAYTDAD